MTGVRPADGVSVRFMLVLVNRVSPVPEHQHDAATQQLRQLGVPLEHLS
jgi:hypothetical protein